MLQSWEKMLEIIVHGHFELSHPLAGVSDKSQQWRLKTRSIETIGSKQLKNERSALWGVIMSVGGWWEIEATMLTGLLTKIVTSHKISVLPERKVIFGDSAKPLDDVQWQLQQRLMSAKDGGCGKQAVVTVRLKLGNWNTRLGSGKDGVQEKQPWYSVALWELATIPKLYPITLKTSIFEQDLLQEMYFFKLHKPCQVMFNIDIIS